MEKEISMIMYDKRSKSLFGLLTISLFMIFSNLLISQDVDDALRYSFQGDRYTSRVQALGLSYMGISDDVGALHYNPAGLSLMSKGELSVGMRKNYNTNSYLYNSQSSDYNSSRLLINNAGVTFPVNDFSYKSGIGFSYFNTNNFSGLNTLKSLVDGNTFIENTAKYAPFSEENGYSNIAYELYLTDDNYITPIRRLNQEIDKIENGGFHNLIFGYGTELSDIFSIGFSINASFGSYGFTNTIYEYDKENLYSVDDLPNDINFYDFDFTETVNQDLSGFAIKLGMLFKPTDNSRLNFTFQSPTWIDVDQNYAVSARARNDEGSLINDVDFRESGTGSFRISTPIIVGLGYSMNMYGLTLTSGLEYSDQSTNEFDTQSNYYDSESEENSYALSDINEYIIKNLGSELKWGLGAEYFMKAANLFIRGSVNGKSSPWVDANIQEDILIFGGGLGFVVGKSVRIDLSANYTKYKKNVGIYGFDENLASYENELTDMNFGLGVTYRFE